jgi:dihydrolipoamide dehydrogenase
MRAHRRLPRARSPRVGSPSHRWFLRRSFTSCRSRRLRRPSLWQFSANGHLALLHEAADEGHIAGKNAVAEGPANYCRRTQLTIVFSAPGVARVGARLADLDPDAIAIGSADFTRQGRARILKHNAGLMRIYADAITGRLEGAEMCVPAAEHMAHLLALAIERRLTVQDMLAMPFYHPVLEEGLRSALRDLARQLPQKGGSDLSYCPEIGIEALD